MIDFGPLKDIVAVVLSLIGGLFSFVFAPMAFFWTNAVRRNTQRIDAVEEQVKSMEKQILREMMLLRESLLEKYVSVHRFEEVRQDIKTQIDLNAKQAAEQFREYATQSEHRLNEIYKLLQGVIRNG